MSGTIATAAAEQSEIRVYLPYSLPVDVRHIVTIADMDISYAIASTLVQFDKSGQVSGNLVDSWKVTANQINFKISAAAKWSDGTQITAQQVVDSLNLAKADRSAALNGLFDSLKSYSAPSNTNFRMDLKTTSSVEEILKKLTEPCYGIVRVKDAKVEQSQSSGAFVLTSSNDQRLILVRNPHWIGFEETIAKTVEIRRPVATIDQDTLNKDSWPNLITSSSLTSSVQEKKNSEFNKWHRNSDRVFFVTNANLGNVEEGRKLLSRITHQINRKNLLNGISGYRESAQFFPAGTIAHTQKIVLASPLAQPALIKSKKHVKILYSSSRVPTFLLENFRRDLSAVFPSGIEFIECPLEKLAKEFITKKYDLYLGSVGVDGANLDGAVSYYVEFDVPVISSDTSSTGNFKQRLKLLREQPDSQKVHGFSKILSDAVENYYVVPLFHYSTTALSRQNLILSSIPATDETVSLSKVRVHRE